MPVYRSPILSVLLLLHFYVSSANAGATEEIFDYRSAVATFFVDPMGSDNDSGTIDHPWATINHAADVAVAGDTIFVRGGRYILAAQVRPHSSGRSDAWISLVGYPGEEAVLDAGEIPTTKPVKGTLNNGAFQIEGVSHIRVVNLTVINSHDAGITVRDSSDIELINNTVKGTYSSGIAVWDTIHDDKGTERIRVIGNTVQRATTWDLAPPDMPRRGEPPHEALSIGGAVDFEVAYNHVFDSDKEGIVIKETSKRGKVHHNLVEKLARQGIYVGSFFGAVTDIEVFSNVVRDCHGAGFVLSVEHGQPTERINFHHNLVFNNDGSGVYFSRWGVENLRKNITISNNIFYHNGYGRPAVGQTYYWHTGGIYLYSSNIRNVFIGHNILDENRGFQIGFSELFLKDSRSWLTAARRRNIVITQNLVHGDNISPIRSGGNSFDQVQIYATVGSRSIEADPLFKDPAVEDFSLRMNSPATNVNSLVGALTQSSGSAKWWQRDFPPQLFRYH
jgi:parallel beta-helix repeat protein